MPLLVRKQPHRKCKLPVCKQPSRRAKSFPAGLVASSVRKCVASVSVSRGQSKRVTRAIRPVVGALDDDDNDDQDSLGSSTESNSSTGSCMMCGDKGSKGCHCVWCEDTGMIYD